MTSEASTSREENRTLAQELGADEAIDYTSSRFEEVLKSHPVDVVIDPMAGAAPQIVSSHVAVRF